LDKPHPQPRDFAELGIVWPEASSEDEVREGVQPVGDSAAFQAPFADKRLSFRFDLLLGRGIDMSL
jgi:hypothetical protein